MTDDLLLISDDRLLAHVPPGDHPEAPARLQAALTMLRAQPRARVRWRSPAPAPPKALLRVHSAEHLRRLHALRGTTSWITADTAVCPESVAAIELAAGSGIAAVDALFAGEARRAFCLIRPPGHHAKRDRMMGACFINNIAVAAAHARAKHNAARVMIVDWGVHHGNGTESIFFADPDVLVVDAHQTPLYPDSGEMNSLGKENAFGATVNLPLPAGTGDGDLLGIYGALLPVLVDNFRPDLILVSAGFDGHRDDPVGGFDLSCEGFAGLCAQVRDLADRHCQGRLALLLEGGYNPEATARSITACVDVLLGAEPPQAPPMSPRGAALLSVFRAHHGLYWPDLLAPKASKIP